MASSAHPPTFKAFGTRDEKDVLAVVRDPASDVRFIRLFFPDILGRQMDFTIPAGETRRLGESLGQTIYLRSTLAAVIELALI